MTPFLQVERVTKGFLEQRRFPRRAATVRWAVSDVSCDIHRDETPGLVGKSGCRKT